MASMAFEVKSENIICNDVTLPREIDNNSGMNPHNVRLWVIGHPYGAVCDAGMLESFVLSEKDSNTYPAECDDKTGVHPDGIEYTSLGNAGELHDLTDCWITEADLQAARDIQLIVKLARAAEGGHETLEF